MSTRYMKKVYGGDVLAEKDSENESEVNNSLIVEVKSNTFNVFDLLNENSEVDENDNEEQPIIEEPRTYKTKPKKRKKKRNNVEGSKAQDTIKPKKADDDVDEIESSVREVNKLLGEALPGCSSQHIHIDELEKSRNDILLVRRKHLNPSNELLKFYGSKMIQAERTSSKNRGRVGHLKKTWLVSSRDNWPLITLTDKSGLSMSLDKTMKSHSNVQYFVYDHSPSYRQVQLKFLEAVESLNSENIVNILRINCFHIDALLQLSEHCKLFEELSMAAEITERALYSLECAFHPFFNPATTPCRLDYRKQQNRALFITLFKHLSFVGNRSCYRTSLELCKLLLSLDPDGDPLAVILFLDFYALKAHRYRWFIDFCIRWYHLRNVSPLPNIEYSLAIAHFRVGDIASASSHLQTALLTFPGVLVPLLNRCNMEIDEELQNHDFFNSKARMSTSPALEKLQTLYVVRSFSLWKCAEFLPWLEETVRDVLNHPETVQANCLEYKQGVCFQGRLPINILRHIILSDIKDVTINGQEVRSDEIGLSHDPLPPVDSIDIYKRPTINTRTTSTSSNLLSRLVSYLLTDSNGEMAAAALNGLNLFHDNNGEQT